MADLKRGGEIQGQFPIPSSYESSIVHGDSYNLASSNGLNSSNPSTTIKTDSTYSQYKSSLRYKPPSTYGEH